MGSHGDSVQFDAPSRDDRAVVNSDEELEETFRNNQTGEISKLVVVAEGEERVTYFVWLLVACSSISGLLFGYDTGVVSGALVTIGSDLGPASHFIVGTKDSRIELSYPLQYVIIGNRFLIGVGVEIAACVAPLYIQELSPTRLRGRMVVLNVVMITLGQVIAYGIDAAFYHVSGGWRWMVGLGAVPAGLQSLFLFFLPESRSGCHGLKLKVQSNTDGLRRVLASASATFS